MKAYEDPRITAFGLLTEVHNGLAIRLGQASPNGLSAPEFSVLIRLVRSPGSRLRLSDLATQTTLSTSGVTRLVDRLEQQGLVEREPCPTDRRSSYAKITAAGAELIDSLAADSVKVIDRWFTGLLSPERLDEFLGTLRIIRDEVHPGATAGS
ncbi:MarR family winged helix-turn-helix transcriptional regulator [Longispora albida]|uniref:MarR family winged helix-turn-helix transcriptional regulator n=1 Tax=Longispora albida TaxID=203523 RepID=UPI0003762C6F|nr:MarR family transcriptional regulator [Longispora albida]